MNMNTYNNENNEQFYNDIQAYYEEPKKRVKKNAKYYLKKYYNGKISMKNLQRKLKKLPKTIKKKTVKKCKKKIIKKKDLFEKVYQKMKNWCIDCDVSDRKFDRGFLSAAWDSFFASEQIIYCRKCQNIAIEGDCGCCFHGKKKYQKNVFDYKACPKKLIESLANGIHNDCGLCYDCQSRTFSGECVECMDKENDSDFDEAGNPLY